MFCCGTEAKILLFSQPFYLSNKNSLGVLSDFCNATSAGTVYLNVAFVHVKFLSSKG